MAGEVREGMVAGPLANVSVAYRNSSYIADRVFPIIDNVPTKAVITKYLKGSWFRSEAALRAPGSAAPRSNPITTPVSVSTKEYAFASEVTDEDRRHARQAGSPQVTPDIDAIEFATGKVLLKKEIVTKALIAATTWADGNSGGEDAEGLWAPSDSTNTFLVDIATGIKTIHNATGIKPNRLIVDLGTWLKLKECAAILDKIKYTARGIVTADLVAAACDLEEVLIGTAFQNTAKETKAGTEFTASPIWELNATKGMGFLFYAPSSPGLKVPSAGYQAREWYEGGLARYTNMFREPDKRQDVYEVSESVDIVVTGADLGYLWKDTLLT